MEGYGYPYPPGYPPMLAGGEYPDHGDGFGAFYPLGPLNDDDPSKRSPYMAQGWPPPGVEGGDPWEPLSMYPYYWPWMPPYPPDFRYPQRPSCSKYQNQKHRRSRSHGSRGSSTKSHSRSGSRSRSHSRSKSRSASRSHSRSRSLSRHHELNYKEPTLLDAFRVMYLTPSKHKKSTTKYLATKKKQDRIQEILKSDGLGSKRWLFYPRTKNQTTEPLTGEVPGTRDNVDQRIKVDGDFFRKYKNRKKVDVDAPIAKLRRWELVLYKKLGFLQAV